MTTKPSPNARTPQFEYWVVNKDRSVGMTVPFKAVSEAHAQEWVGYGMIHNSDYYNKFGGLEIVKRQVTRCTCCGQVVEAKREEL